MARIPVVQELIPSPSRPIQLMPFRRVPLMALSLIFLAAWSCQSGPSLAEGKKLLANIRSTVETDAADKEIDELQRKWSANQLGVSPKDLDDLRYKGHVARLRALCVDLAHTDRDVSQKVAELRRLSKEWNVPFAELSIRIDGKDRMLDEAAIAEVQRRGFVSEAKHWLAEYQSTTQDYDRVANFEMLKQALKDAHATPAEIGITDSRLIAILKD